MKVKRIPQSRLKVLGYEEHTDQYKIADKSSLFGRTFSQQYEEEKEAFKDRALKSLMRKIVEDGLVEFQIVEDENSPEIFMCARLLVMSPKEEMSDVLCQ